MAQTKSPRVTPRASALFVLNSLHFSCPLTTLKAAGEIESFETVILRAHGGDLGGFFLLRGEPERLGRLSMSPEFLRLIQRANAVVERLGVVPANLDAEAVRVVGEFYQATADLI